MIIAVQILCACCHCHIIPKHTQVHDTKPLISLRIQMEYMYIYLYINQSKYEAITWFAQRLS